MRTAGERDRADTGASGRGRREEVTEEETKEEEQQEDEEMRKVDI